MKLTNLALSILFLGFIVSCGSSHDHDQDETSTEKVAEHPSDVNEAATEIKLSLNNGDKWNSDESTFTGMKRLEITLYNFTEKFSDPSVADYNKLGEALANIDKDIISQCTMKGKDHDQLHILLAPMLGNVDVIKNSKEALIIKDNIIALNKALIKFFEHFKVY